MSIIPIDRVDGVPDQLIEAINDRLRRASTLVNTATMAATKAATNTRGATGPRGPAGSPGTGIVTPQAPDLVAATAAPVYSQWANVATFSFNGTITVADTDPHWTDSATITVVAFGPSAPDGKEIARLLAPFTVASHDIAWTGADSAFLQAATTESWTLVFTVFDTQNIPSLAPITVSAISVGPAAVDTLTGSELLPRFQDENQGLLTRASAVVKMVNDQVPQVVAFWISRDNGSTWLRQGLYTVTTSPQTVTLPFPSTPLAGLYVSSTGNETWKIAAAAGPITDASPPGTAVISAGFAVNQVGIPNPAGVTSATSAAAVTFIDGMGIPNWEIPLVSWTDPLTDPADQASPHYDVNAWFTVLTFQCTDSAGNPAPGSGSGNDQGGDEVEITRAPVLGGAVQSCTTINSFGFNPVGSIYTYARLKLYTVNRLSTTSWQDPTNAVLQTTCWGGADHVLVNFGSFPGSSLAPAAFAPNLTAASTPTVNYVTEGGLPKWNFNGTVTLPSPSTAIKKIHITIAGLPQILEIPSALFGVSPFTLAGLVMSYQTPNFPRDTVTFNYTVQFWVENSDGILTASPPSASITVTGTAAPFNSVAPAAPTIATAGAIASWTRDGHVFDLSFSTSFTAPATGAYSVRVTAISPAGEPHTVDTSPGPFTSGQVVSINTDVVGQAPATTAVWTVRFLPINQDNVASAPKDVLVTVAPNVITAVTGAEDTSRRFIEPGGGSKTWVNITPTITTSNAPGFGPGPQVITTFLSFDNGVTYQGQAWADVTASNVAQPVEVWRPTVADQTCKAAAVIGAIDFTYAFIPAASLPPGTVIQSGTFTLVKVGAPLPGDCLGGFVNTRTAVSKNYNDITIQTTGDGVQTFGLPDGLGFVNPPWSTGQNITASPTFDPNFFYAVLTTQCVDASGNPAPADLGGIEEEVQRFTDPGTVTCFLVQYWEFNPPGSIYTRMRFRVRVVSRSAVNGYKDSTYSVIQTSCWGGAAFKDIIFGDAPTSSITATATPAPTAPQLLSATINYNLIQVNGAPCFNTQGVLTFPTSDPNYSTLVEVRLYIPQIRTGYLFSFLRPSGGWTSPLNYLTTQLDQPLVATNYAYEFRTVNADGVERTPGLTGALPVPAAVGNFVPPQGSLPISSVTLVETGTRVRLANFTTQANLHVTINLPANVGTQNYTAFYCDNVGSGDTFLWTNWYPISGTSGSFDLQKVVPAATKSVRVAIVPGALSGDPSAFLPLSTLTSLGATFSNTMAFNPVAAAASNVIASASLGSVQPLTDPNGQQDWFIPDIVITDVNPIVDPYAKFCRLKVFICNSAGTRATAADGGLDQIVQEFDVDGTTHHCNLVSGWGFPNDPTMDRARFFLEVVNAAGTATVQNCWGVASFADAIFGAIPTPGIPAARIKPGSFGPGIISDPTTNQPTLGNPNPSTSLLNDWDFRLSYPATTPSNVWTTSGGGTVSIFNNGINGGPYASLNGSFAFIQQRFACAPSQAIYFQVAARGHGSGTLTLACQFYTQANSFISSITVATVSGGVTWVANALAGVIAGTSVPSTASTARLTLQTSGGGSDFWDCTSIIARQVVQQNQGGNADTMAGANGGLGSTSTTTTASAIYCRNFAQLVGTDGSQVALSANAGSPQVQITTGANQINLSVLSGIPNIQVVRGGTPFNGVDTILQDNLGVNHTVKNGIIVT